MPSGSSLSVHSFLSASSSSRCATQRAGVLVGWLPFSFLKGEEANFLGPTWHGLRLATRWFHWLFLLSLSHSTEIVRVCLLISASLQVGYHCFELLRQPSVKAVMLQLGDMVWQKAFQEWHYMSLEMLWQMHAQSNTNSFSPICSQKSSWFKVSKALMLLWCLSSLVNTLSMVISFPELLTNSPR